MQVKTFASNTPAPMQVLDPPFDATLKTRLVSTVLPRLLVTLNPATTAVFQAVVRVPETGEYFITQAASGTNGTTSPYESIVISRCDSSGNLLGSMKLNNAGHGTALGIEYSNGVSYVWTNFAQGVDMGSTPAHDLLRFPYASGTFNRTQITGATTMPKFDAGYNVYEFDWAADYMVVRNSSGTRDTYIRRKISEVRNGVNVKYGQLDLQQSPPTLQGFATLNNALFRYIGSTNGETANPPDPTAIQQFNWTNGVRVDQQFYPDLGKNANGQYIGGQREPESLSVYRDPTTGRASLLMGITTGLPSQHTWPVYILEDIGDVP